MVGDTYATPKGKRKLGRLSYRGVRKSRKMEINQKSMRPPTCFYAFVIRFEMQRSSASHWGEPQCPFLLRREGIQGYAMRTRTAKTFVLWNYDMPTLLTNICAIRMDIHCHEVVESNTIRAADDHRLAPQLEFRSFVRVMLHPKLLS